MTTRLLPLLPLLALFACQRDEFAPYEVRDIHQDDCGLPLELEDPVLLDFAYHQSDRETGWWLSLPTVSDADMLCDAEALASRDAERDSDDAGPGLARPTGPDAYTADGFELCETVDGDDGSVDQWGWTHTAEPGGIEIALLRELPDGTTCEAAFTAYQPWEVDETAMGDAAATTSIILLGPPALAYYLVAGFGAGMQAVAYSG